MEKARLACNIWGIRRGPRNSGETVLGISSLVEWTGAARLTAEQSDGQVYHI